MVIAEIKEKIKHILERNTPAECRILITPIGHKRVVFISTPHKCEEHVTWRELYKGHSYQDLLRKVEKDYPANIT